MNYPSPPQQMPPAKKGPSGCLIALAILGGLVVLGIAAIAFGLWRFSKTEDGKALVDGVQKGYAASVEAQSAPGTNELRTMGCATAAVFDNAKLAKTWSYGDGGLKTTTQRDLRRTVVCGTSFTTDPPPCDQVAATYVRAVGPVPEGFVVVTSKAGHTTPICQASFSPDATRLSTSAPPPDDEVK